MPQIVHALSGGLPLCGFTKKVPRDWPPEHCFVPVDNDQAITCQACRRVVQYEKVEESNEM